MTYRSAYNVELNNLMALIDRSITQNKLKILSSSEFVVKILESYPPCQLVLPHTEIYKSHCEAGIAR